MPRSIGREILDKNIEDLITSSLSTPPTPNAGDIEESSTQVVKMDIEQFFEKLRKLRQETKLKNHDNRDCVFEFSKIKVIIDDFHLDIQEEGISRHLLKPDLDSAGGGRNIFHYFANAKYENGLKELFYKMVEQAESNNSLLHEDNWNKTPLEYALERGGINYACLIAERLIQTNLIEGFQIIANLRSRVFYLNPNFDKRNLDKFYKQFAKNLIGKYKREGGCQVEDSFELRELFVHNYYYQIKDLVKLLRKMGNEKISSGLTNKIVSLIAFLFNCGFIEYYTSVPDNEEPILHEIVILANYNRLAAIEILQEIDEVELRRVYRKFTNKFGDYALHVAAVYVDDERAISEFLPRFFEKIFPKATISIKDIALFKNKSERNIFHKVFRKELNLHAVPLFIDKVVEHFPDFLMRELLISSEKDWSNKPDNTPLAAALKREVTPSRQNQSNSFYNGIIEALKRLISLCVEQTVFEDIGRLPLDAEGNTLLMLVLQKKEFHELLPLVISISDLDQARKDKVTARFFANYSGVNLEYLISKSMSRSKDEAKFYVVKSEYDQKIAENLTLEERKRKLQEDLQEARKERDKYEKDLKRIRSERDDQRDDLKRIRGERDGHKTKTEALEKKLIASDDAEKKAREDHQAAQRKLETQSQLHTTEVNRLRDHLTRLKEKEKKIEQERNKIVEKLGEQEIAYKNELHQLRKEKEVVEKSLEALKSTTDAEIKMQKDEIEKLKEKLAESQEKNKELSEIQADFEQLKQAEEKLKIEVSETKKEKESLSQELDQVKGAEENLRDMLSRQQKDIETIFKEKKLLEAKVKQLEKEKQEVLEGAAAHLVRSVSEPYSPNHFKSGKHPRSNDKNTFGPASSKKNSRVMSKNMD